MNIDLDSVKLSVMPQFKGGVGNTVAHIFDDGAVKVLKGHLEPGASIGLHAHEGSCEVVFITGGHGHMLYDGGVEDLAPGTCSYCPEGHEHSMVNDGDEDLSFLSVIPAR